MRYVREGQPSGRDRLCVRQIVRPDWSWIEEWFTDEELNQRLGPLDELWLQHVLSDLEGAQLVVETLEGTPVALVGCAWDPAGFEHAITDVAVDPLMRRNGIGRRAVQSVLMWDAHPSTRRWVAFVEPDNAVAFELFSAIGWNHGGLDEGMHRFCREL